MECVSKLLETIRKNPDSSLDSLGAALGKPPFELLPELTKLELAGEITERGGRYSVKAAPAAKPKPKAIPAKKTTGSKIKARAKQYKNIVVTQSCTTVRRDADTGKIVPTCDTTKDPERFNLAGGISGTIEFKCDGSGQPASVRVRSITEPEIRKALKAAKTEAERQQIEDYRKSLAALVREELQTAFDRDRLEEAIRSDETKAPVTTLGVEDFDYAALDLGNLDKRSDAQSIERAVNKYRGASMKIRYIKKKPKASGRGTMPFTDKVVNRYFDQSELEFLGGTKGAQGADRAVTVLETKR